MASDVFGIVVTLNAKAEHVQAIVEMVKNNRRRSRHEATFVNATIEISDDDPNQIILHEIWRDRHDFEAVQRKREYRQDYERRLPDMLRSPREMKYTRIVHEDYNFHAVD